MTEVSEEKAEKVLHKMHPINGQRREVHLCPGCQGLSGRQRSYDGVLHLYDLCDCKVTTKAVMIVEM